ncbi:hypothetical protein [Paenibacillus sp. 23TSA30-6]|uniref:hypothetical protein n=1 Tax=Paenibacillus sp. 23TSA30-6 TaxID=2546104 RepID=UPI001787EEDB|nr:hypothetical protein [Paenibacillus sp. 23TSA30-6]
MIERLRHDSELEWEEMFQLAGGLKRQRELGKGVRARKGGIRAASILCRTLPHAGLVR